MFRLLVPTAVLLPAAWGGVAPACAAEPTAANPPARQTAALTLTLKGQGTAAGAAAADDAELACCRRRFFGGYAVGYYTPVYPVFAGGYAYGCGGFGCGYTSVTYFQPVYAVGYYRPCFGIGYGYCVGGFCGIGGTSGDATAPVVTLNRKAGDVPLAVRSPDPVRSAAPIGASGGGLRYDGGPAEPVPLPRPDATQPSGISVAPGGLPVFIPGRTEEPAVHLQSLWRAVAEDVPAAPHAASG